ncbi:MAG: glycosyltransferase family 2 protein [Acidobacteria bacterium]|jgi:glycosyltransferase involved in cell wall biosynthesis|nr:glycosyltransferase family 2 protein [Acidobacteriota bacterium]
MKEKPFISVIIPVYNDPRISSCILSLLEQDYPADRFEILVIDNNSTDSTPGILRQYKDRIILLSENKQGSYAARNKGLQYAKGSIYSFTDADCIQPGDWLSKISESFRDDTISAVQGITYGINSNTLSRFICHLNISNIYKKRQKDGFLMSLNTRNCAVKKNETKTMRFDDTFLYWGDFIMGQEIVQNKGKIRLNEELINSHCNIRSMRKYIGKNIHVGESLCRSLQAKPLALKHYLSFLVPIFNPDFNPGMKLKTLAKIGHNIMKFYYNSLLGNEESALESLQHINALSFSWGLNCIYSHQASSLDVKDQVKV